MPTSFTPLLGLALPATGELSGTWGDTVNNSITSLVESAVAGTTTLNTDADVTLTTNTGASNQARQAVLLCTGARTAQRTITAPAQSKTYIVVNNTTGGFSVKLVGSGPTAGITVDSGERALVVWNGSDFVKLGYASGVGVFTSVVAGSGTAALPSYSFVGDTDTGMFAPGANTLAWSVGGTEVMRLDSSGNFIVGTGSPTSRANIFQSRTSGVNALALSLHDSVTGSQTPGFGQRINWYSNGTATNAAIGFEVGGDGTNNQSQIAFYTQSVAGGLTRRAVFDELGNLNIAGGAGSTGRLSVSAVAGSGGDLVNYANTPIIVKAAVSTDVAATRTIFSAQTYTNSSTNYALTQLVLNTANNTASRCAAITVDASGNLGFRTNGSSGITSDTTAAGTEWMRLTSAGLLQLAAGNTGGGVALNNAANTSPTVLDWYEEGTFTPTLTGIGTPTYTTQLGSYTRIGNVVHFNITLNWTGGTNGAGITVASLPFTAAGVNTPVSVSVNYLGNASFTWTGVVKAYVSGGTANIALVVESSGASNGALLNPSAGTKDVIISGTYRVA